MCASILQMQYSKEEERSAFGSTCRHYNEMVYCFFPFLHPLAGPSRPRHQAETNNYHSSTDEEADERLQSKDFTLQINAFQILPSTAKVAHALILAHFLYMYLFSHIEA